MKAENVERWRAAVCQTVTDCDGWKCVMENIEKPDFLRLQGKKSIFEEQRSLLEEEKWEQITNSDVITKKSTFKLKYVIIYMPISFLVLLNYFLSVLGLMVY